MNNKGICNSCTLKENCAKYKENKSQCENCESYKKVLTNEEWFCQLPTYKKAILMANCYDAFNLDQYACNKHVVIEEWLQEEHKE